MNDRMQSVVIGVLAGSVWAFSEIILGTVFRSALLPLKGTLLTGTAAGLLFCVFAWRRRFYPLWIAMALTMIAKLLFSHAMDMETRFINAALAVILTGGCISLCLWLIDRRPSLSMLWHGPMAGFAVMVSGSLFYLTGSHLEPCVYLRQFSFVSFFIHEILFWSLFAWVTASAGWTLGQKMSDYVIGYSLRRSAWAMIGICWLGCGLTFLIL